MRANYEICLSGQNCILVPYRPEHVPNYHEWMQDPFLLEATASEPLSMEEEVKMQLEWRDDEQKCTFIILARDLLNGGENSSDENLDVPPPPTFSSSTKEHESPDEMAYSNLVENSLHGMIGDINLFFSEEEDEDDDNDDFHQAQQISSKTDEPEQCQPTKKQLQAELDLMIAKSSHRHKNLGTELALMMMHYGASSSHLQIRRYFVKIKETNESSLKLFRDKLGFVQCGYAACFGEVELECKCETAQEMVEWVREKWDFRCKEMRKREKVEDGGEEQDTAKINDAKEKNVYNLYKCPLSSLQ